MKNLKLKDGAVLTYPFKEIIDEIICDGTLTIKSEMARIRLDNINIKAKVLDLKATTIIGGTSQIKANTLRMMGLNSNEGGICFNELVFYPIHFYGGGVNVTCDIAEFRENPPHVFKDTRFVCNTLIVHRVDPGFFPVRISDIISDRCSFDNVKFKRAWVEGHVIEKSSRNNMLHIKDMDLDEFNKTI